jgi:hypothetical protein
MNLPNRLEFLFITVEALPKASNSGLIYEKQNIIILVYLIVFWKYMCIENMHVESALLNLEKCFIQMLII